MFLDAFTGAFAANLLMGLVIYGCWRLNRDERDWSAYAMVIGAGLAIALAGLASLGA